MTCTLRTLLDCPLIDIALALFGMTILVMCCVVAYVVYKYPPVARLRLPEQYLWKTTTTKEIES